MGRRVTMGIAHGISFTGARRRFGDMFMDVFSIRRVCRCYGLGGFHVRGVVFPQKKSATRWPRAVDRRGAGPPAVGADHRVCYRTGPRGGGGRTHGLPPQSRPKRARRRRGGARLEACGQQVRVRPERLGPVMATTCRSPPAVRHGWGLDTQFQLRDHGVEPIVLERDLFSDSTPTARHAAAVAGDEDGG